MYIVSSHADFIQNITRPIVLLGIRHTILSFNKLISHVVATPRVLPSTMETNLSNDVRV